jgi:hypothetical protein
MEVWLASRLGRFTPWERDSGTHWIEGWAGPRADLDSGEDKNLLSLREIELGRPPRGPSLYRLSYPGSPRSSYENYFNV